MDRGAWWAAVYGVAQGWTRLKQLSSSSSRSKRALTVSTFLSVSFGRFLKRICVVDCDSNGGPRFGPLFLKFKCYFRCDCLAGGAGGGCLASESHLTLYNLMVCSPPDSPVRGICMQEYWSALLFPFPDPEIEPPTPISAGGFFITEPPGKWFDL